MHPSSTRSSLSFKSLVQVSRTVSFNSPLLSLLIAPHISLFTCLSFISPALCRLLSFSVLLEHNCCLAAYYVYVLGVAALSLRILRGEVKASGFREILTMNPVRIWRKVTAIKRRHFWFIIRVETSGNPINLGSISAPRRAAPSKGKVGSVIFLRNRKESRESCALWNRKRD